MAGYKRQHYVSKFYLKSFSEDNDNVYVYNLKRHETFKININDLCQEKYFNSNDPKLEQTLGEIESEQALILKKLINNLSFSSLDVKDQSFWNLFITWERGGSRIP